MKLIMNNQICFKPLRKIKVTNVYFYWKFYWIPYELEIREIWVLQMARRLIIPRISWTFK